MKSYIVLANDGKCIKYLSGSGQFIKTKQLAWKYESREDAEIVANSFSVLEDNLNPRARYYVAEYCNK